MHPVFFEIHSGLPREGPGDDASTTRALRAVAPLPSPARVLDIGCGPGAQTLVLARRLEGSIVAVDNHPPFVEALQRRAAAERTPGRIEARVGDMRQLDFQPASFDLIWSEGAIYNMGFAEGLTAWRPLLAAPGALAVSEATWLEPGAPADCVAFWREGYPAMTGIEENLATARAAGYDVVDQFALPESAWWDYYRPIERRLEALREKYRGDDEALAALEAEQGEIDMYRRCARWYGYVFYVLRCPDGC